jgi:hypothetical protein
MEMFQLELMVGKFVRVWFPVVLSTGWCSSRLWLIVKFAPVVFLSECCIRLQWRQWCRSLSFFFNHRRCGLFCFSSVCGRRIRWWCTVVLSAVVLQGLRQFLVASGKVVGR